MKLNPLKDYVQLQTSPTLSVIWYDSYRLQAIACAVRLKVEINMQKSEIQHRSRNPLQHPRKLIIEIHQRWTECV